MIVGHGIGVVRDLPIPAAYFFVGAAVVLAVSFVLLLYLWRRPVLEAHADGRALPSGLSRLVLSRAVRIVLGAFSVFLLGLTLATALFGTTVELLNFAPTFVYVIFWLGIPLLSILFGNVWSVLSPWRALADAAVWAIERGEREARPVLEWTGRLGRYPAAAALFAFVALELAHPRPDVSAHARNRDRAVHVLGAGRDGGVRPRPVDAIRRGLRRRLRAPRANRAVRSA